MLNEALSNTSGGCAGLCEMVERLRMTRMETRRAITQEVQDNMAKLYQETKQKHMENITRWLARWNDVRDVVPSILT